MCQTKKLWPERMVRDQEKNNIQGGIVIQGTLLHCMGIQGNTFFAELSKMRRQELEALPKWPSYYQLYIRHPDFKEAVEEAFKEWHGDEPASQHLKLRCQVAWELFEQESEEVKVPMKEECDKKHEEEVLVYEEADGLPSTDPAVQASCRENFLTIAAPLLAGISTYTRYHVNLIAGRMEEDSKPFDVVSALVPTQARSTAKIEPLGTLRARLISQQEWNGLTGDHRVATCKWIEYGDCELRMSEPPLKPAGNLAVDVEMGLPLLVEDDVDMAIESGLLLGSQRLSTAAAGPQSTAPALAAPPLLLLPLLVQLPLRLHHLPPFPLLPLPLPPLLPHRCWTQYGEGRAGSVVMGLQSMSAFVRMKRKMDGGDSKGQKKKQQRGEEQAEEEWGSDESDSDSNEDDSRPRTPVKTRRTRANRTAPVTEKATAAPKASGGGGSGKPEWAVQVKGRLQEGQDMGEDWVAVMELWWHLEELDSLRG
ncbi:hypothetical protein C8R45DRAFT_934201 [Mycena sanguinolenta]|nr:hypothetical protein C8R45DRAFT_934201 [Mycena sanguinolenta]